MKRLMALTLAVALCGTTAMATDLNVSVPEIRLARPDGSEDRRLVLRNGGAGLSWTPDGREIVYAEAQVHETFSVFNDLSAVEVAPGAEVLYTVVGQLTDDVNEGLALVGFDLAFDGGDLTQADSPTTGK